jgi:hypothetical protein
MVKKFVYVGYGRFLMDLESREMTRGLAGGQVEIARQLLRSYFGGVYTAERLEKMSDEEVGKDVRELYRMGRQERGGTEAMQVFLARRKRGVV